MKVIVNISRANNDKSGDSSVWIAEHGLGVIRKIQNLRRGTMDRKLKRTMVEAGRPYTRTMQNVTDNLL